MTNNNIKSTLLILSIASLTALIIMQAPSQAFADVSSPKKQTKIGIDPTDIICKANLVKVYRINADSTDCFKPSTAQKLMDKGIAKDIPKDRLEAKKSFKQNSPIGTVTGLSTVKQFGAEGKLSTNLRVVEYVHVFEVCAKDKTIRAPEVLVKSDSEAKTVKLAQKIMAEKCYTSSAKIKATISNQLKEGVSIGKLIFPVGHHEMYYLENTADAHIDDIAAIVKKESSGKIIEIRHVDLSKKGKKWNISLRLKPKSIKEAYIMSRGFD